MIKTRFFASTPALLFAAGVFAQTTNDAPFAAVEPKKLDTIVVTGNPLKDADAVVPV